jgi:hypothetical protein
MARSLVLQVYASANPKVYALIKLLAQPLGAAET